MNAIIKNCLITLITGAIIFSFWEATALESVYRSLQVDYLQKLTDHYRKEPDPRAIKYALQSVFLAEKSESDSLIAESYRKAGQTYLEFDKADSAWHWLSKSFARAIQGGEGRQAAKSSLAIGDFFMQHEDFQRAYTHFQQATDFAVGYNMEGVLAPCYEGSGRILAMHNRLDEAVENYQKGLDLYALLSDSSGVYRSYFSLADIFLKTGKADSALLWLSLAESWMGAWNERGYKSYLFTKRAEVFLEKADFTEALKHAELGYDLAKEENTNLLLAYSALEISRILLGSNQLDRARIFLLEAMEIAEELNDLHLLKETRFAQYLYLKEKKDFRAALENHQYYTLLAETINNEDSRNRIARLNSFFESEKKDREITLLSQEAKLQQIEAEKNLIISIILFSCLLMTGLLIFWLVLSLRQKNRANQELELQKEELLSQNKNIKRIIEEQQRLNETLRTQGIELEISRQKAEEAAKTKAQFLSTMSHEIRTPMNAVIGMTGLLTDTELTPDQQEFVNTIKISGESLLSIINDILDFSKIESGILDLEENDFKVSQPIEEVFDLMAPVVGAKNLELIYLVDQDVPEFICSDITRLRQILMNLVNNAVKFTEEGEVFVAIASEGMSEGRLKIRFSVTDTGIGIPKDKLTKLFQSFSQVDASTTRKYGGTGLGLVISKKLVELMGGTIEVDSIEGVGTTFSFTIAVKPAEKKIKIDSETATLCFKDKKVLVVDDNLTNLRVLELLTKRWGMKPITAKHPHEALALVDAPGKFDLVIMDMMMPEMDGIECTKEIRKRFTPSELPIVMLTSLGIGIPEEDRSLFAGYATKPARQSQLYNMILEIFTYSANTGTAMPKVVPRKKEKTFEHNRKIRILIAEDNPINQKVALRILSKMGYSADVAGNGLEAVNAVKMMPYDLVFMDMQMPEMDGLEASRCIRKMYENDSETRPIIIAMTANAMLEDRQRCLDAGMDDYIAKPIQIEKVESAIIRWFYQERKAA